MLTLIGTVAQDLQRGTLEKGHHQNLKMTMIESGEGEMDPLLKEPGVEAETGQAEVRVGVPAEIEIGVRESLASLQVQVGGGAHKLVQQELR